jgi:hypothetical protein
MKLAYEGRLEIYSFVIEVLGGEFSSVILKDMAIKCNPECA